MKVQKSQIFSSILLKPFTIIGRPSRQKLIARRHLRLKWQSYVLWLDRNTHHSNPIKGRKCEFAKTRNSKLSSSSSVINKPSPHLQRGRKLPHLLSITPVSPMLLWVKILPFVAHRRITFHLRHGFCPLKTIGAIMVDEVIEDECIGPFTSIFRQNADKKQVDRVGLMPFQNTQQGPPP